MVLLFSPKWTEQAKLTNQVLFTATDVEDIPFSVASSCCIKQSECMKHILCMCLVTWNGKYGCYIYSEEIGERITDISLIS